MGKDDAEPIDPNYGKTWANADEHLRRYELNFPDSTEHTVYNVQIASENGEVCTLKDVDDATVKQILELV